MKRTIDMMTAARAKGVELPGEWFDRRCLVCGSLYFTWCDCLPYPTMSYIGPDLELPANLHHAFRFADAIDGEPVDVVWDSAEYPDLFVARMYNVAGTAPERHLALIAACEAALGIQHEKEIAT